MRFLTNRPIMLLLAGVAGILPAAAQSGGFLSLVENPSMETNYILLGMAVLQVIIILTLSGIMKTLGGNGQVWVNYLNGRKAGMVLLLVFAGMGLDAQAATPGIALMTSQSLFWWLFVANAVFFIIVVAQLMVLKGLVRTLSGKQEQAATAKTSEPDFADTILSKLTKRVEPEQEKDILMHHEYDGIRELDNVLPPWWLWLFYGTIIWGVVYVVNVHVIKVWPDQETEYAQEMAQAEVDIAAYLALQAASVDENTVVMLTDASAMGSGKATFEEFCKACHGAAGEGNAVGPNLTDAYWIHGGSINDLFRTIKYGVAEKGMQSWKGELNPQQMQAVSSYILSLQGTNPPNAKEPQGELYVPKVATPEEPATEQTDATADAAVVAVVQ
ncbi:MAG: cbb3-type cytochrome c oxidase N-terminal domain-containing protein [Flavobacteriales bacterium]